MSRKTKSQDQIDFEYWRDYYKSFSTPDIIDFQRDDRRDYYKSFSTEDLIDYLINYKKDNSIIIEVLKEREVEPESWEYILKNHQELRKKLESMSTDELVKQVLKSHELDMTIEILEDRDVDSQFLDDLVKRAFEARIRGSILHSWVPYMITRMITIIIVVILVCLFIVYFLYPDETFIFYEKIRNSLYLLAASITILIYCIVICIKDEIQLKGIPFYKSTTLGVIIFTFVFFLSFHIYELLEYYDKFIDLLF